MRVGSEWNYFAIARDRPSDGIVYRHLQESNYYYNFERRTTTKMSANAIAKDPATAITEDTKEGHDLCLIYHEATEEVECGNCHAKIDMDELHWQYDIDGHELPKGHQCEFSKHYLCLKFTGCSNECAECKLANIYFAANNDEEEEVGQDNSGYVTSDDNESNSSSDDESNGEWYTDRDGVLICKFCGYSLLNGGDGKGLCVCSHSRSERIFRDMEKEISYYCNHSSCQKKKIMSRY